MRKLLCCSAFILAASFAAGSANAATTKYVIGNNTPRYVATAQKLSDVDPAQVIDVVLWLKPHNRDAIDALAAKLYDKASPQYHHFLKAEEIGKLIGPAEDELHSVAAFAVAHNLSVVQTGKYNVFLRVRGTADAMQKAFNVKLANVSFRGRTLRTNLADPAIEDEAGSHISAIQGLDDGKFEHHHIAQAAAVPGRAAASTGARDSVGISNVCFNGAGSETFTSGGVPPTGMFTGNFYANSPGGCGYAPKDIQTAYGLTALYNKGIDGTGQTIAIVDWCGSPTITADANAFSKRFGLPALTPSNFAIVNYPGTSSCSGEDAEINIDVEWAHAIAPGANEVLVVPATNSYADIDSALSYIVLNGGANIVSNSYGSEEIYTSSNVLELQNFILETAADEGVSMNFSSGDGGDETFDFGFPASVSAPADSPYAVAVGGISLSLNAADSILWQGPWGTNVTNIADQGLVPVPSENFGFQYGSGGGTSVVFAKPKYQSMVPGKFRKLPDISWLGDPFTGAIIAITVPFTSPSPVYQVYGGTSLACPMFAGLWALANQAAGTNLGFAAPALYSLPSGAITDIVPVGSANNVTGLLTNGSTKYHESAGSLAKPLAQTKTYVDGIWNYPSTPGTAYVVTFGTDSGLTAKPGWDDATGLGVPVPGAFISALQSNP